MGKLKYPEFVEYADEFDIICLTETMLDDLDSIDLFGFACVMKNRSKFKRKSGGIAVLIRNELLDRITIVENKSNASKINLDSLKYYRFVDHPMSENCLFFELKDISSPGSNYIVCGVVYAPPINSTYANIQVFNEIEEALLIWDDKNILLMGDYNARTGKLKDYIYETNENGYIPMSDVMETLRIRKNRCSMDRTVNKFGEALIDFCVCQSLLIANGRVGRDVGLGKLTCKDASLVDYLIMSPTLFHRIEDFYVDNFDECLSDVHCPVLFTLREHYVDYERNSTDNLENEEITTTCEQVVKPAWKPGSETAYLDQINSDAVEEVKGQLTCLAENIERVSQTDIDNVTSALGQTMIIAAKKMDMIKQIKKQDQSIQKQNKKKLRNKHKWFDVACKEKRANYRRAKRRHRKYGTVILKAERKQAHKEYKRNVNKKFSNHRSTLQSNIRGLRSTDPRSYWKLINNACDQNRDSNSNTPSSECFVDHFNTIGNVPDSDILESELDSEVDLENEQLSKSITLEEVKKCKLNNNKASGTDYILNEFLKHAAPKLLDPIRQLFDIVLKCGKIPETWSIGVICPIYKGKGCPLDVDNYRGITILSCLGKLFSCVLNERINAFLEDNKLLGKEQAGFRKGYSTADHVFSLHCLIDLYLQRKKRLYCSFIDYKKAFDKVQRNLLWDKLLQTGICGNVLTVIKDMYLKAKSCVKTANGLSTYFSCNIGVRQGQNLSPILFAMFLNDLKQFLDTRVKGLGLPSRLAEDLDVDGIESYMHLFLLMNADDTIILSESPKDMQTCLDALEIYCDSYGLQINTSKTKVVVFSRGKIRILPTFLFKGDPIEVVFDYKYLGTLFNFNNKFNMARKA